MFHAETRARSRSVDRGPFRGPQRQPGPHALETPRFFWLTGVKASTWRGSGGEVSYSSQTRAERIKLKELSLEKQGITYEPYVAMMVLEQFDRTYDSSIGGALDASFGEDLEGARSVLQDALLSLDPKHLIGRQRLLKALQDLEVSANNPEEAIRINETMEEATLEIAKAYARGQEQAGKFTATQAAAYVKAHEGARDTNSAFLKLQLGLTGPDPNNGLQRVSGIIDTAAGAAQRGDEPRPNEPEKSMTQDSQEGDADRGDETGSLN